MFLSLSSCRKLGTAGQRMGGSAALCHIRHDPVAPGEHGGCFTLKAANVGRCQAVLCRDGKAMQLSSTHTVREEPEYQRVRQHNAIITEVTQCVLRGRRMNTTKQKESYRNTGRSLSFFLCRTTKSAV